MTQSLNTPPVAPTSEATASGLAAAEVKAIRLPSARSEWGWWLASVLGCGAAIVAIHARRDEMQGVPAAMLALALCASLSAGPMIWRRGRLGQRVPVISTLLTITVRMLTVLGAFGIAAATKWPQSNSFMWSLLGCYFIFLTLESVLSTRWYSSQTRVEHR